MQHLPLLVAFHALPYLLKTSDTDHLPPLVVSCSDAGEFSNGFDSHATPSYSTPTGTHSSTTKVW